MKELNTKEHTGCGCGNHKKEVTIKTGCCGGHKHGDNKHECKGHDNEKTNG